MNEKSYLLNVMLLLSVHVCHVVNWKFKKARAMQYQMYTLISYNMINVNLLSIHVTYSMHDQCFMHHYTFATESY